MFRPCEGVFESAEVVAEKLNGSYAHFLTRCKRGVERLVLIVKRKLPESTGLPQSAINRRQPT